MEDSFVIIHGNPFNGSIKLIGPFPSSEAAYSFINVDDMTGRGVVDSNCDVISMTNPKGIFT